MENENKQGLDKFFGDIEEKSNQKELNVKLNQANDLLRLELLNFTKGLIRKAESKNNLKDRVVEILEERLNNEEEVRDIPTSVLSKLLSDLAKTENDFTGNILNAMKTSTMAAININLNKDGTPSNGGEVINPSGEPEIDKEHYNSIKNVLSFLNKVKDNTEIIGEAYEKKDSVD
jgi:hypothetical protein